MDKAEKLFEKLANIYMDGHTYTQPGKMPDNEHDYKDPSKRPYAGKIVDNNQMETPVAQDRDTMRKEEWQDRGTHMEAKAQQGYAEKKASVENIINLLNQ